MADKRISQLIERTNIANNDVLPIVASAAITTNKVTVSTLQDWMQDNLDLGVTSVGITVGTSGTDVNVTGSPITSSGNITINIPTASATNRGLLSSADWTTFNNKQDAGNFVTLDTVQSITANKSIITGGGGNTLTVSQTSGSGIALNIGKFGNGEGLKVEKFSGSGNAVTIIGGDLSAETAKFSDLVEISANAGGAAVYLRGRSSDDLSQLFFFGSTPGSVQNYIQSQPTSLEINSWNDTPIVFRTNVTGSGSTARLTISGAGNVTLTGSLSGTSAFFNSTMRIGTINNGAGDFITTDANGVLTKRTASQTLTDIGGVGGTGSAGQVSFWTGAGVQSGDGGLSWDNTSKQLLISDSGSFGADSIPLVIQSNGTNLQIRVTPNNNSASEIKYFGTTGGLTNGSVGHHFYTRLNFGTVTERWAILSTGIFQSNGAQTIQTSTGALTLATGGGNGNIILSPNGTGNVGIGTTAPDERLDVAGTIKGDRFVSFSSVIAVSLDVWTTFYNLDSSNEGSVFIATATKARSADTGSYLSQIMISKDGNNTPVSYVLGSAGGGVEIRLDGNNVQARRVSPYTGGGLRRVTVTILKIA